MSAANFNRTEPYTLTLVAGEVDRTTWWKDENRREPAGVWWIEGPGVSRPATDIEVNLWQQNEDMPPGERDRVMQHAFALSAVRLRRIAELESALVLAQKELEAERRKRKRRK